MMKKISRRNFLKIAASSTAAVTAAMLVGCKETSSSTAVRSAISDSTASPSSNSTAPAENAADSAASGYWTLEECREEGGLFCKTADDRFVPFNNFDCVRDIGDLTGVVEAYIDTYDAAVSTPVDSVCFFMLPEFKSSTFWVYAYRINETGWMPSMLFPGNPNYRMVTQLYRSESDGQVHFFSTYGISNYEDLWIRTIDGVPAAQSPDIVTLIDYGSGKVEAFSNDAKGKWITLGYAEGTTLTEQDCQLSVFYGRYGSKIGDGFKPEVTPTTDGYAILDFASGEEGLYALDIGIQGGASKHTLVYVKH